MIQLRNLTGPSKSHLSGRINCVRSVQLREVRTSPVSHKRRDWSNANIMLSRIGPTVSNGFSNSSWVKNYCLSVH